MAEKFGDAEVGRGDSNLPGEQLLRRSSLLQSSSPTSIKIMILSGDVREEIVGEPEDTIRTMVDLFVDKSGGLKGNTEFGVITNEGKVLVMEDSLTEAGVRTGDILHVQAVNQVR